MHIFGFVLFLHSDKLKNPVSLSFVFSSLNSVRQITLKLNKITAVNIIIVQQKSGKSSRPSTPKIDENNERQRGSPVPSSFVDGSLPRLKIKAPKPDGPKNSGEHFKCELDDSKPVIRIANAGLDLKRKADPLSTSLPSLKLKIPQTQESQGSHVEPHGEKLQLSTPADSSLKLVVSNGKIVR